MNFEEQLREWNIYFNHTRGVGHTHSCLKGVENTVALLICANQFHAKQHGRHGFNFQAIEKLRGFKKPVVFDNHTIQTIIIKSLVDRVDKQRIREVRDKLTKRVHDRKTISPDELTKELDL